MACRSVSDPAVVILLVIGLLVSLRVVANATREKDGRARPERTPVRRKFGKLTIATHRLDQPPGRALDHERRSPRVSPRCPGRAATPRVRELASCDALSRTSPSNPRRSAVHRVRHQAGSPASFIMRPPRALGMLVGRGRRDAEHRAGSSPPDDPVGPRHRTPPSANALVRAISLTCAIGRLPSSDTHDNSLTCGYFLFASGHGGISTGHDHGVQVGFRSRNGNESA